MHVGITGTFASGKGEIAKILRKRGFRHYGFGEVIREELTRQGLEPSIENSTKFGNYMRSEHGAGYFAELLLKKMEDEAPRHAVFESIRHPAELAVFRRLPGFVLIAVDAPREERFERLKSRGRSDGLHTFEEFCQWEDHQLEGEGSKMQILKVMDAADVRIVNVGNLEELEAQVKESLNL